MNVIKVVVQSQNKTVKFAAEQLCEYLNKMGLVSMMSSSGSGIQLDTYDVLGIETKISNQFDDEVFIDLANDQGIISGPNPRSVLISVYKYLTKLGCRFIKPGVETEYIPKISKLKDYKKREKPSYRYRSISIEGSNKLENVIDMIDWLPKVGMNSFHIQLKDGYTFYDRWYKHRYNPYKDPEHFDLDIAKDFTEQVIKEIDKRELIYQAMGHGLTTEPFGIKSLGWDKEVQDIPENQKNYFAEINGKREFRRGIPVNTNACYSNEEVRKKIVDYIVEYCITNKEVDLFHFWLADDFNNYCECENCSQKRPSDWYVMMLNQLDEALNEKNCNVKVVFLIFYESLWPPLQEKLINQERFSMIFAPLSRKYSKPIEVPVEVPELKPFVLNDIKEPETFTEDVSYYREWKKHFQGDSIIYIYHLMTTGWEKDLTDYALAQVLHEDLGRFKELDLNGVSSCQSLRSFFPTGLTMHVLATSLWDNTLDFKTIATDYFQSAYGSDGLLVDEFLKELLNVFDPFYLQHEKERVSVEAKKQFQRVSSMVEKFKPVVERNLQIAEPSIRGNWELLDVYCYIVTELSYMFENIAEGESEKVRDVLWPQFIKTFFKFEDKIQKVFDLEWFTRNYKLYQIDGTGFRNYD